MAKTVLKLQEFFQLDIEINGFTNSETGEVLVKGLLAEKISVPTKYWLYDLAKKVTVEKEAVNSLREELIKKYGTADEQGNISIPIYINEVVDDDTKEVVSREVNPAYVGFQNDFNSLLNEDRELEHHAFQLGDFEKISTETNYIVLFKLIQAPNA
jgi:hypothetical protein